MKPEDDTGNANDDRSVAPEGSEAPFHDTGEAPSQSGQADNAIVADLKAADEPAQPFGAGLHTSDHDTSNHGTSNHGTAEQSGEPARGEGDRADVERHSEGRGREPRNSRGGNGGGGASERRQNRNFDRPRARAAAPAESSESDESDDDESFTHDGSELEYETDDPLAPAYDLERGTPLSHNKHGEHDFKSRTKIRSAKEFFNTEILYRYDILDDEDRTSLRGRYRIELKGYQGGVWTIVIAEQMDIVNRREDAEIVFTMQQSDFLHLVNGQLNPQLALFAQKMRVSGDVRQAVHFQNILAPGSDG